MKKIALEMHQHSAGEKSIVRHAESGCVFALDIFCQNAIGRSNQFAKFLAKDNNRDGNNRDAFRLKMERVVYKSIGI